MIFIPDLSSNAITLHEDPTDADSVTTNGYIDTQISDNTVIVKNNQENNMNGYGFTNVRAPVAETDVVTLSSLNAQISQLQTQIDALDRLMISSGPIVYNFSDNVGDSLWAGWSLTTSGSIVSKDDFFQSADTTTTSPYTGAGGPSPGGGFYAYMEASAENSESLTNAGTATTTVNGIRMLRFYYHMYGAHMGRFRIQYELNNTGAFFQIAEINGEQQKKKEDAWIEFMHDFRSMNNFQQITKIRFYYDRLKGADADLCIDYIQIWE